PPRFFLAAEDLLSYDFFFFLRGGLVLHSPSSNELFTSELLSRAPPFFVERSSLLRPLPVPPSLPALFNFTIRGLEGSSSLRLRLFFIPTISKSMSCSSLLTLITRTVISSPIRKTLPVLSPIMAK